MGRSSGSVLCRPLLTVCCHLGTAERLTAPSPPLPTVMCYVLEQKAQRMAPSEAAKAAHVSVRPLFIITG